MAKMRLLAGEFALGVVQQIVAVIGAPLDEALVQTFVAEWLLRILNRDPFTPLEAFQHLRVSFDTEEIGSMMVSYCQERLKGISPERVNLAMVAEIQRRRVGDFVQQASSLNHWLAKGNVVGDAELQRLNDLEQRIRAELVQYANEQFAKNLLALLNEAKRENLFLFGISGLNF